MQQKVNVQQILQMAANAEAQGIPVDWKTMCGNINVAVTNYDQEVQKAKELHVFLIKEALAYLDLDRCPTTLLNDIRSVVGSEGAAKVDEAADDGEVGESPG